MGIAGTELGNLHVQALLERLHLGSGGLLVLVHERLEAATGTLGFGEANVGNTADLGELTLDTVVHGDLVGLEGLHLAGNNGDLAGDTGVDTLGLGSDGHETHREVLAELLHLGGGLLAGSCEVLDSLGETAIGERGLLGESLVELLGSTTKSTVELGLVLGKLLVGFAELVVGLLGSLLQLLLEEGKGRGLALGISRAEFSEGNAGTALLVGDGSEGGLHLGLDGSTVSLGDLAHTQGEDVQAVVHVLDLLLGLLTEGVLGAGIEEDGIPNAARDVLGVGLDGASDACTVGSRLLVGSRGLLLEGVHCLDGVLHGESEVVLRNLGHGLHSVDHLATEGGTGTLAFGSELVHRCVRLPLELGNLLLEVVVDQPLGVLVHLLATLLNKLGTLLASGDGPADGGTELVLVCLLEDGDLLTTGSRFLGVALHDTGELGDLLLGSTIVLGNDTTKVVDLPAEGGLGKADVAPGIKLHAAGGSLESGVLLGLEGTLGAERSPHLGSLLSETALGMLAVAGKGLADLLELGVEAVGHLVELASGLGLTLVDETLELSIVLEVGTVTLVAELDHALHLGSDVVFHLGLGSTVLANDASGRVDPVVHLSDLATDSGSEVEQAHLELGGGLGNLSLGFRTSSLDVTHSLGVATVLERLLGVQGSGETHGGLTQGHVDFVTVLGHLGLDLGELSTVEATMALILLVAQARVALSCALNWRPSLLLAAFSPAEKRAILWFHEFMALFKSLVAFLAFSVIAAALAATCLLARSILALVAAAQAAVCFCQADTARRKFLAFSRRSAAAMARVFLLRALVALWRRLARDACLANFSWVRRIALFRLSLAILAFLAICLSMALWSL